MFYTPNSLLPWARCVGAAAEDFLLDLLRELIINVIIGPSEAIFIAATLYFHGELFD